MTFSRGKGTNNFTNIISTRLRFYSYLWEDICIKTIFERRRFISYWIFMSCLCSVVVLIHGIGATRRIVTNNTGYTLCETGIAEGVLQEGFQLEYRHTDTKKNRSGADGCV